MDNPFVMRYLGFSDHQRIIDRVTLRPLELVGLETLQPLAAAKLLGRRLEEIYIPNQFAVDFIAEMIESSEIYSSEKYSDQASYSRSIYHPQAEEVFPLCLTGLAGVGKSALVRALFRALPLPVPYKIPMSSVNVDLISYWSTSARDKSTTKQILINFLEDLAPGDSEVTGTVASLLKLAQRTAGMTGLPLMFLDELQHTTFSSTATAAVTSQLLTLSKIGVPIIYVSNFSLLHKLSKRNSEEKHRLLSSPIIMMPDDPDSPDWANYIEECSRVVGHYLEIDAEELSSFLYVNTFGLKRFVVTLFRLAYIEARKRGKARIGLVDFYSAQVSAQYTNERDEVSILVRQEGEPRCRKDDLWCPFELPKTVPAKLVDYYRELDERRLAQTALERSLTPNERITYEELTAAADPVRGLKALRKRSKHSLQDLLAGHLSYLKGEI